MAEDPEFFKNNLESKPFSENYEFKGSSFITRSILNPIFYINCFNQSSVYRISKQMYLIITLYIVEGYPGILIAIIELVAKKEISYN